MPKKQGSGKVALKIMTRAARHQLTDMMRPMILALKDIIRVEIEPSIPEEYRLGALKIKNINAAFALELAIKIVITHPVL